MDFRTHFSSSSSLLLSFNECNMHHTPSLGPFVRFYIWISTIEKDKRNEQKPQSCYVQRTPIFYWNTNVIRYDTCSIHHRTYISPTFGYITNNQVHRQHPFHIKFVCLCYSIHILNEPFWLLFCMGPLWTGSWILSTEWISAGNGMRLFCLIKYWYIFDWYSFFVLGPVKFRNSGSFHQNQTIHNTENFKFK